MCKKEGPMLKVNGISVLKNLFPFTDTCSRLTSPHPHTIPAPIFFAIIFTHEKHTPYPQQIHDVLSKNHKVRLYFFFGSNRKSHTWIQQIFLLLSLHRHPCPNGKILISKQHFEAACVYIHSFFRLAILTDHHLFYLISRTHDTA